MIGFDPSEVNERASRAPDSNIGRFCIDIIYMYSRLYKLERILMQQVDLKSA